MVRGAPGSWKAQMEKKLGSYTRRLGERQTFYMVLLNLKIMLSVD